MSHPSWVCGLKPGALVGGALGIAVTPFVGVWIETPLSLDLTKVLLVTPFVGVWIETKWFGYYAEGSYSHTLRGCVD